MPDPDQKPIPEPTDAPETVEHLIIGAGQAGLVLNRLLQSDRTVILDPHPARYKIGESIVPEHFFHPELRALVPRVRQLPSYTPKDGTTFVTHSAIAAFPLGADSGRSLHIDRSELEQLMLEVWGDEVRRERVKSIDFETRLVQTDVRTYRVEGLILDCSGPSRVVARALGEVETVRDGWAAWSYYDVVSSDPGRFWDAATESGKQILRYDARWENAIQPTDPFDWQPSHTTILTAAEEGVWTWQIPLFNATRLSFGAVSRKGPITDEALRALQEATLSPAYQVEARPTDGDSPYDRIHRRKGFAEKARRAAGDGFILVGDAFSFSDPVYSVGTALAVNNAVEVAELLNAGRWPEAREAYCEKYEAIFARALAGFDCWYDLSLLEDESKARGVQDDFLRGKALHVDLVSAYGNALRDSGPVDGLANVAEARLEDRERQSAFDTLRTHLESGPRGGWRLVDAVGFVGELHLFWETEGHDRILVRLHRSPTRDAYARVEDLCFEYLDAEEQPCGFDEDIRGLMTAVIADATAAPALWQDAIAPSDQVAR